MRARGHVVALLPADLRRTRWMEGRKQSTQAVSQALQSQFNSVLDVLVQIVNFTIQKDFTTLKEYYL